ncbi:MAG: carbohydrate ABC transporter permease [Phycisphaerales bacterium]
MIGSTRKRLLIALAFLLPNLLGFLVFTAWPIVYSLWLSVTDFSLTRHNELSGESPSFVGLDNYARLIAGDESHLFWDYFGNTVFLMIGIPLGIAGSLGAALLLHAPTTPRKPRARVMGAGIAGVVTVLACAGVWALTDPGPMPEAAVMSTEVGLTDLSAHRVAELRSMAAVLAMATLGVLATVGMAFGSIFFRAIFYLPSLLAGVAMFLLWKTLYRPRGGLINAGLQPVLDRVQWLVERTPAWLWYGVGIAVALGAVAWGARLMWVGIDRARHGEAGGGALFGRVVLVGSFAAVTLVVAVAVVQLPARSLLPTGYAALGAGERAAVLDGLAERVPEMNRAEVSLALEALPDPAAYVDVRSALLADPALRERGGAVERALGEVRRAEFVGSTGGDGLRAPEWLISRQWAKTALVIMGVWLAIGGGNMLLYLAGLANVPPELYEAASIDGASGWQRFIHVTWPQLAPTTFFIVIMSTIGGLQGGFEQALVMTEGKADTIVLAYYIYQLAFTDQFQLGLASAVAWVMCGMIFVLTAINYRLGSRMTNE